MPRSPKSIAKPAVASPLVVRLDEESKALLSRAAGLRRVSVSDYVRTVALPQARRDVLAAGEQTVSLTPDEQVAFWQALHEPSRLTPAQRQLGEIMRGEA